MSGLVCHRDKVIQPQDRFPFKLKPSLVCVDSDGETIRKFQMEEFTNSYIVLFFLPMDFKVDATEVLAFSSKLDRFQANKTKVVGVTQDNPFTIRHWIQKERTKGGFGQAVGFPIISDRDQSLAEALGVASPSGMPCRATFIIDWSGYIRYCMVHRSDLGRSVEEILRLSIAYRHSDLTGELTTAKWKTGGDEVIPTDYTFKTKYYKDKYGKSETTSTPLKESSSTDSDTKSSKENPKTSLSVSGEYVYMKHILLIGIKMI